MITKCEPDNQRQNMSATPLKFACVSLLAFCFFCVAQGQTGGVDDEPLIPEQRLKLEVAASRAEIIARVKLIDLGRLSAQQVGVVPAEGAQFRIISRFKGESGVILTARFVMSAESTWAPKVGEEFIIFVVTADDGEKVVVKMIRSNAENQKKVKTAIGAYH
jgi:hypothetical protein